MDCNLPGTSVHGACPGKNTGVGRHALLQGVFPTQQSNPGLPNYEQILHQLSHQGTPPPPQKNEWIVDFGYFHICIQTAFIQNKWLYKHTYIICHVLRDPLCTTREYMLPKAVNFWLLLKLDSLDPLVKWARTSQISCHPQHLSLILQHSYVLNLKVYWEWQRHAC